MISRCLTLLRTPRFWWRLVIVWFLALFVLSSLSHLPPGPRVVNIDKIEHTAYFALGATCFYLARRLGNRALTARTAAISTVLFCMVVGAFDEFHQSFVPNRSGNDPFDWMADTLGGVAGALAGWAVLRLLFRRTREQRS
ncbi:MAG: VanZ family protein [Verrucomicrobiaceae bacterium]|nr:VanZ family protein [Verrucomicrobiaceae bacterium]